MTTTAEPQTMKCPSWCTLNPEHTWDSYDPDTGLQWRGHAGPHFGHITVGGQETSDGRLTLDSFGENNTDLTPDQWRDVARDALAAAEWLEAHQ